MHFSLFLLLFLLLSLFLLLLLLLSISSSSSPSLYLFFRLFKGIGCPSDLPSALSQYEYAAKEGHAKAAMAAGNILYDALSVEKQLSSNADTYNTVTDARYRSILSFIHVSNIILITHLLSSVSFSPSINYFLCYHNLSLYWQLALENRERMYLYTRKLCIKILTIIFLPNDTRLRRVMNLYRVAASQGVPDAMNCLGLLLEDGRGITLCVMLHCVVLCCVMLHCVVLCCVVLYCVVLCCTVPCCTVLCYVSLCYSVLYQMNIL